MVGCTSGGGGYAVFDRDPVASDELPAEYVERDSDLIDAGTSRLVGEHEGTRLYLVEGATGSSICLVVLPADEEGMAGCGGGGGPMQVSNARETYEVRPDGYDVPDGAVQISENVFAVEP